MTVRMEAAKAGTPTVVETDIPARLDRLSWNRFHTLVIVALGVTWVLDGLEVTLAGAISGALKESPRLRFTNTEIGYAHASYLVGAVGGALFFGWLTDRWGRKKLFFITLALYLTATAATAFSWNLWSFCLFRFVTGAGIGGEYTAINSTIQEFVPAKYRGRIDLLVNGSFWIGAALGAGGAVVLLDPALLSLDHGWRLCFLIGAGLGLVILLLRTWIPESPRWLATHGRPDEGEAIVRDIERWAFAVPRGTARKENPPPLHAERPTGSRRYPLRHAEERAQPASRSAHDRCASFETPAPRAPQDDEGGGFRPGAQDEEGGSFPTTRLHARSHTPLREVFDTLFRRHRRRALVGLALMSAQAFFYNAIFFTYALVLTDFYGVSADRVGLYILPFALGNFLGPLLLGPLFDTVGRRVMISLTYILSGVLLALSGWLFQQGILSATGQTAAWMVVFFFASAAASSAYLTVGETFPLEVRALAIAVFYAVGTGIGGAVGPLLFGILVDTGSRTSVFGGYLLGAGLMVAAGLIQAVWGVASERRSLEEVATPLSVAPQ